MKHKINKYIYMYYIQGYYASGYGWEDLCAAEDRREARALLRDYEVNDTKYPHRLILRRELNPPYFVHACVMPEGFVYYDRTQEEHGDCKRLAFLPFDTLRLGISTDCPPPGG